MQLIIEIDGRQVVITDEDEATTEGHALVLDRATGDPVGEALAWEPDAPEDPEEGVHPLWRALSDLADAAGIWGGPRTRAALMERAEREIGDPDRARGADLDALLDRFRAAGGGGLAQRKGSTMQPDYYIIHVYQHGQIVTPEGTEGEFATLEEAREAVESVIVTKGERRNSWAEVVPMRRIEEGAGSSMTDRPDLYRVYDYETGAWRDE